MSFVRQKAELVWLSHGDENSHLFYQSIKLRRMSNKIHVIQNAEDEWINNPDEVQEVESVPPI